MDMDQTNPKQINNKRKSSPTIDKATLALIQADYVNGNFKSVSELALRYSINQFSLHHRIKREKWEDLRQQNITKLASRISEKAQSIGERYLESTFKRARKYESIIDASQSQLATNDCGVPLMDCEAINDYTLAEQRIHELAKSALRIPSTVSMDVTSKGASIGESLVQAITRLRSEGVKSTVTHAQIAELADYEIVKTVNGKSS